MVKEESVRKRMGRGRGREYHSCNCELELGAQGSMDSMEMEECWGGRKEFKVSFSRDLGEGNRLTPICITLELVH